MNTVIQLRASRSEKPTVRGGRAKNADYRQREYLTESEIDKLVAVAGESRNPIRDRLLILMAFRHALRVSELVGLRPTSSLTRNACRNAIKISSRSRIGLRLSPATATSLSISLSVRYSRCR